MRAIVIGSGVGGLSAAIRLAAMGLQVLVLEKLPGPGGRAFVHRAQGFTFDMGPTVITVPPFLEDLFATGPGDPRLYPDFPKEEGLKHTERYVKLVPLDPFYRLHFPDGTYFDYKDDPEHLKGEIARIAPEDLEGYRQFEAHAKALFQKGFLELGFTHFGSLLDLLKVAPDLLRLDAVRPLFSLVSRYFKSPKTRQIFSFEPLLIGGNPLKVPALYAMIHFVERHWGVHFAMGGTGALVRGLVRKLEELGGKIRYGAPVRRILTKGRRAVGVVLQDGEKIEADLVVSNADYVHTYGELLAPEDRTWNGDWRLKRTRLSMSLFVAYFASRPGGTKGRGFGTTTSSSLPATRSSCGTSSGGRSSPRTSPTTSTSPPSPTPPWPPRGTTPPTPWSPCPTTGAAWTGGGSAPSTWRRPSATWTRRGTSPGSWTAWSTPTSSPRTTSSGP